MLKYLIFMLILLVASGCSSVIKDAAMTNITIESTDNNCKATYKSAKAVVGAKVVWERKYNGCVFKLNSDTSKPDKEVIKGIVTNNKELNETLREAFSSSKGALMPGM
jgi:uncharacterized protein YceK